MFEPGRFTHWKNELLQGGRGACLVLPVVQHPNLTLYDFGIYDKKYHSDFFLGAESQNHQLIATYPVH